MEQTFPAEHAWEVGCPVPVNTTGGNERGVDLIPDLAREEKKMAGLDGGSGGGLRGTGSGGFLEGEGLSGGDKVANLSIPNGFGRGCGGGGGLGGGGSGGVLEGKGLRVIGEVAKVSILDGVGR